jgi:hypothetical protein
MGLSEVRITLKNLKSGVYNPAMVQKSLTFFITTLWRTISGLFWLSLWFFSLGLLASYLLRWWPGDRLFPVRLINYAMPWLLFALAPGLIVALLARRQW